MKRVSVYILILVSYWGDAQVKSPFNDLTVQTDSSGSYSFFVSGHFYGGGSNSTGYPANTLLANLDMINGSDASMLICLGDLFLDISHDIPFYEQSLFEKLEKPLYNAVGNHDITDQIYQENFGATHYAFEIEGDLHVILDTELDDGDIRGEQLDFLKNIQAKQGQNIFIYAHRTIWKDTYPEMDGILNDNTQSLTSNNFEDEVLPVLKSLSEKANIYWFAGSIGGAAPASFLYHKDEENGVTYIATAIRALPRDAMLEINVKNGSVEFETISLTGQDLKPLQEYNVDFWQTTSGEPPFNWKLVPYYFQLMLTHRYFWYGVGYTAFGIFVLWLIVKRRRRLKPSN